MRSYIAQRATLARMEAARAETERHIVIIERQISARRDRDPVRRSATVPDRP